MSIKITKDPTSVVFSQHNVDTIPADERICAICQEALQNTAENPVIGHELHLFDKNCIAGSLAVKAACPICRALVENAEDYANAQSFL